MEIKRKFIVAEEDEDVFIKPIEKKDKQNVIIESDKKVNAPYPIQFGKKKKILEQNLVSKEEKEKLISFWSGLILSEEWKEILKDEFKKQYFQSIANSIEKMQDLKIKIFPPMEMIFNAFNYCEFSKIKCVIIGQDPYHGQDQAHGLCFSVQKGVTIPPSLNNIYKELESDIGFKKPSHGYLIDWTKQGVFLLNTCLTVESGKPNSHKDIGWNIFTQFVLNTINQHKKNVVFILLGKFAQQIGKNIDKKKHHIIEAAHPSPFSATQFFGCKVFSKTNDYLKSKSIHPIDWSISDE
jgi:uracil-DNA glycosylase